MTDSKHSPWSATALLVAALAVTVSTGAPIKAHAGEKSLANDQQKIKARNQEEDRVKEQDTSYNQQAKAMAKQYQETARLVASQGGDPRPLLDAAAYFAGQTR